MARKWDVIATLLVASVAGACGAVWLLGKQGVSGLCLIGGSCLLVGLLGVSLQYGTSAGFKERHLSGPGWELFRNNMRRAWVLVLVGVGVIVFEYWSEAEKARISRQAKEKIEAINKQIDLQQGRGR